MNNVDKQYLDLLRDVIENGSERKTRSGLVKSVFGRMMRFNLNEGLPLLTTKKVSTKGIIHELLWFISGSTNIKYLVDNGVNIWNDDAFRYYNEIAVKNDRCMDERMIKMGYHILSGISKEEFLEKVKSGEKVRVVHCVDGGKQESEYKYGDIGAMYGKNWRSFGSSGKDQIDEIVDLLRNYPTSRRIILTCYDPDTVDEAALYPCHILYQFYTKELTLGERIDLYKQTLKEGEQCNITETFLNYIDIPKYKLSCMMNIRSNDLPLGCPYNICSAALLTHMLAHVCNMTVDELVYVGGDCHIYENQLDGVHEQLKRNGSSVLPQLSIQGDIMSMDDFNYDSFVINNYHPDTPIKFPLSVGY